MGRKAKRAKVLKRIERLNAEASRPSPVVEEMIKEVEGMVNLGDQFKPKTKAKPKAKPKPRRRRTRTKKAE